MLNFAQKGTRSIHRKLITIYLPARDHAVLSELVRKEIHPSIGECVRIAIRDYLLEHLDLKRFLALVPPVLVDDPEPEPEPESTRDERERAETDLLKQITRERKVLPPRNVSDAGISGFVAGRDRR